MIQSIKEQVTLLEEAIMKVFNDLHQIPEIATQEFKTAAYLAKYLEDEGFQVFHGIGGTGLVAYVHSDLPGPVLGIRADMDALEHLIDG